MRLINTETQRLEEIVDEEAVAGKYAILSHTWDAHEVTYQDMIDQDKKLSNSWAYRNKIMPTCRNAHEQGLRYAWIDTCCIDKSSSAELSEAINSMYRWYQSASICYVYLTDMPADSGPLWAESNLTDGIIVDNEAQALFKASRWFTRGWTLQELIAPRRLCFYSADWTSLGNLENLISLVPDTTGIPAKLLLGVAELSDFTAAQRMSWAANRKTTRIEDRAYSLLGIFDINMPMLYGEGSKAFIRLQEELIKTSCDHSIFAWEDSNPEYDQSSTGNLFASSPDFFARAQNITTWVPKETGAYAMTNRGLEISLLALKQRRCLRVLNCRYENEPDHIIALNLSRVKYSDDFYVSTTTGRQGTRLKEVALDLDNFVGPVRTTILRKKPKAFRTQFHETAAVSQLYSYKALQRRSSIRLLRLMPGDGQDIIRCHMLEKTVYDATYEALSWFAEDEPWDQTILINESGIFYRLEVPTTLIVALETLRQKESRRTFWINKISINQRNNDEMNISVGLYSSIFRRARNVCIWLGEGNGESKEALRFIKNEVIHFRHLDELIHSRHAAFKWRAMLNVLKRPWFSYHLWALQEISANDKAAIHCGNDSISWKDFANSMTSTHQLTDFMTTDLPSASIPEWFESISGLGASRLVNITKTVNRIKEPVRSLEYLVSHMSVFRTTAPHDTIYSVLGLSNDADLAPVIRAEHPASSMSALTELQAWALPNSKKRQYRVDYGQPSIDLCREFVEFCISQSEPGRALDIICRPWAPTEIMSMRPAGLRRDDLQPLSIQISCEMENFPTWISSSSDAAYGMVADDNDELQIRRQNADSLVGLPESSQTIYNAAAGVSWKSPKNIKFKKHKTHYSLSVLGFVLDSVATVERHSENGHIPDEWIKQSGWNGFDRALPDDFWRTLVADRNSSGQHAPSFYAGACMALIDANLRNRSRYSTDYGPASVVAEFDSRMQAVIWNKSLLRTKTRQSLGIAKKTVKAGDLVCILYGCSVPVILRRHHKSTEDLELEEQDRERNAENEVDAAITIQRFFRMKREDKRKTKEFVETWRALAKPSITPDNQIDTMLSREIEIESGMTSKGRKKSPNAGSSNQTNGSQMPEAKSSSHRLLSEDTGNQSIYRYELIGECYVDRMMDGEALRLQAIEGLPDEMFELW